MKYKKMVNMMAYHIGQINAYLPTYQGVKCFDYFFMHAREGLNFGKFVLNMHAQG